MKVVKKPILVLRPVSRSPTTNHMLSMQNFVAAIRQAGWDVAELAHDHPDVGKNRDQLAQMFVHGEQFKRFAYALWVDDDMVVPGLAMGGSAGDRDPVEALERLVTGIEKDGVGISSTVAVGRRFPFMPAPQLKKEAGLSVQDLHNLTERAGYSKAARVGMAFTLVKREVFEAMPAPWFRPHIPSLPAWQEVRRKIEAKEDVTEGDLRRVEKASVEIYETGEDYLFCDRAADAGFAVEIDFGTWTGHEFAQVAYPSKYLEAAKIQHEMAAVRGAEN